MKLYLDENLSPKFRHNLDNQLFQVITYQFMGWQGKKNGELLSLLTENNFKGIITSDQLMYTDK
jgi:predicted nuclease of predicted toxin-antitoxin system